MTVVQDPTASSGAAVVFNASKATIPKIGISPGYKILTRPPTERQYELSMIKKVFNGRPGYVRLDSTPNNQVQLDIVVNEVINQDMTPFLLLYGTTTPISPDSFAADQVKKWRGKVHFYEIANEPDLNAWTPEGYADFVKTTGSAIKAADPTATVVAGALWKGRPPYTTQDYVQSLASRAQGSFDMVSLHLYDDPKTRATWNIWDMAFPKLFGVDSLYRGNTCREILDSYGLRSIPIISTETGGTIATYQESGQDLIINHDFDVLQSGLIPSMAVYTMMDDDVPGFGLLRPDKTERPAFTSFLKRTY